MEFVSPSGRVYKWDKPTPPTEEDIAALVAADAAAGGQSGPVQVDSPPPAGVADPNERINKSLAATFGPVAADMKAVAPAIANMGIRGAPPAIGQAIGAMTPIPGAASVLGAIGGMVGEAVAQMREGQMRPGAILGAGVASAVPGAPLAGAGIRAVGREAFKQGGANLLAMGAETVIDAGRIPSLTEGAMSAGMGALGVGAARGIDAGKQARRVSLEKLRNKVADENLLAGIDAGYKLTPTALATALKKPSTGALNTTLESVGGLAASGSQASLENQIVTNKLAARAVGLPENTPLRRPDASNNFVGTMDEVRKRWEKPYQTLTGMSEQAKKDLAALDTKTRLTAQNDHELSILMADPKIAKERAELALKAGANVNDLKVLRFEAKKAFDAAMAEGGDPKALAKGRELWAQAEALEDDIAEAAKLLDQPSLLNELRAARKAIAKSYVIENALGLDGNVSAPILGRMADKDIPLTEELLLIAKFEQTAGRVMRESAKVASPSGGMIKGMIGLGGFLTGANAGNMPAAVAAGVIPFMAPPMANRALMSGPYQRTFMDPRRQGGTPMPDAVSQFARFSTQSAGRQTQEPNSFMRFLEQTFPVRPLRPIPYAPEPTPAPEAEPPPPPKKTASKFKEGKVYRDPETGERVRYKSGEFVPV